MTITTESKEALREVFGHDYDYIKETTRYNDAGIISLFGTREEYIEARIGNYSDFDCLDDDLEAVIQ